MSRAVSVTIALLFAVCGSARQLRTDESAPLVLVRIIPTPGWSAVLIIWPWITTAAGFLLPFTATTAWKLWIQPVAGETAA